LNVLYPLPNIEDGDAKPGEEDATGVGDRAKGGGGEEESKINVPIPNGSNSTHLCN
jgi:hypothetical protein